jgi:hypothetical protein
MTPLATTIRRSLADQQPYPFKTNPCPKPHRPAVEPISFVSIKGLSEEPVAHNQASADRMVSDLEAFFETLTPREREILALVPSGLPEGPDSLGGCRCDRRRFDRLKGSDNSRLNSLAPGTLVIAPKV